MPSSVCLSVCLHVSKTTQKVVEFWWIFLHRVKFWWHARVWMTVCLVCLMFFWCILCLVKLQLRSSVYKFLTSLRTLFAWFFSELFSSASVCCCCHANKLLLLLLLLLMVIWIVCVLSSCVRIVMRTQEFFQRNFCQCGIRRKNFAWFARVDGSLQSPSSIVVSLV